MLTAVCILFVGAAAQAMGSAEVVDSLGRIKRQAGPPNRTTWMEVLRCCPFPMILTDESKTGCFTQQPLTPGGPLLPNMATQKCDVECAYKKQGLVGANGVDTLALGARVAELAASTPAWASVISGALASCTKDNPPVIQAGSECTSGAGEMSLCLNGHMILNCPAAVVDPSPKCTEVLNGYRAFRSG